MSEQHLVGRRKIRHESAVRRCRVGRVEPLTPSMVRIVLVGDSLAGFVTLGPTDHVKVYFPEPLTGQVNGPGTGANGSDATPTGPVRDYTPRAFHAAGRSGGPELVLDFVLHGDSGPASAWASRAAVGDELVVAGPRGSKLIPEGAASYLIGGDETALPAIGRWIDLLAEAQPAARVDVLVVDGSTSGVHYPLSTRPSVHVTWLAAADGDGSGPALLDGALRAHGPVAADCFVWFAGEAESLVAVRRQLRREHGLGPAQAEVSGYWRRGTAALDHHAPLDPTDPD